MESFKFEYEYVGQYGRDSMRSYGKLGKFKKFPRSRLVMMNFLHTKHIPSLLHIHHIDGDSMNDCIDNLMLVTKKIHQSIHMPKDYKFGVSYSDNPTLYERGRRKQPSIKNIVAATSLRWYHRNKDKINNSESVKTYKRKWYAANKDRISDKNKQQYLKRKEKANETTEL